MSLKNKEFQKLKAHWYKKLANSGFNDIEQEDGHLKFWASHYYKDRYNPATWEAKETYYRAAGHFLHDHKFDTAFDRRIWELHAAAVSVRDIVKQLKKLGIKTYKRQVHEAVQRLTKIMVATCLVKQN